MLGVKALLRAIYYTVELGRSGRLVTTYGTSFTLRERYPPTVAFKAEYFDRLSQRRPGRLVCVQPMEADRRELKIKAYGSSVMRYGYQDLSIYAVDKPVNVLV